MYNGGKSSLLRMKFIMFPIKKCSIPHKAVNDEHNSIKSLDRRVTVSNCKKPRNTIRALAVWVLSRRVNKQDDKISAIRRYNLDHNASWTNLFFRFPKKLTFMSHFFPQHWNEYKRSSDWTSMNILASLRRLKIWEIFIFSVK